MRLGSWEEDIGKAMGTLEDVGVGASHPPGSVLVKSWLLRLLGRQIVAAENVSVGRELGTRPALDASAKAGLLGPQRR